MAVFILSLLTQIVHSTLLALHVGVVATQLLAEQVAPLHLLHHVLLEVQRVCQER